MADFKQLRADIVASVLAKCLEAITNCYFKLEINGLLTVTIDSSSNLEIPVSAVCHKAVSNDIPLEHCKPEADSTNKSDVSWQNAQFANLHNAVTMSDLDLGRSAKYMKSNEGSYENDDVEQEDSGSYSDNSHLNPNFLKDSKYFNEGYPGSSSLPVAEQVLVETHSFSANKMTHSIPLPENGPFPYPGCSVKGFRTKRPGLKRKQYSSEALMNAYRKVIEDNASISSAAKLFGVPRSTLRDKLQALGNYKMSNAEETQSNSESSNMAETELSDGSHLPLKNIKLENIKSEGQDTNVEENST